MAVVALKQWFSLKFMQCASIISSESFWKIYLHRWINLEFPWSSLKVVRTSTRGLSRVRNRRSFLVLLCERGWGFYWSVNTMCFYMARWISKFAIQSSHRVSRTNFSFFSVFWNMYSIVLLSVNSLIGLPLTCNLKCSNLKKTSVCTYAFFLLTSFH